MKSNYSVYPRYTAGSPAGVSRELCLRVLAQETEAIQGYLEGFVGEDNRRLAETQGLAGIAIERWEVRNKLFTRDLHTGVVTERPIMVHRVRA